jgi:hypothetical protein
MSGDRGEENVDPTEPIASAASPFTSTVRRLRRLGRFLVFLCTAGWLFPHVCTEEMDLTKIQNRHMAGKT